MDVNDSLEGAVEVPKVSGKSAEDRESTSVLPVVVRTFLLNELRNDKIISEVLPHKAAFSSPTLIEQNVVEAKNDSIFADIPPLPAAPADVPPPPDFYLPVPVSRPAPFDFLQMTNSNAGGPVIQSPTYAGSVGNSFVSPRVAALSSPLGSFSRVVALNLPASNRPISPHSNVARHSDSNISGGGYSSPSHYVRYSPNSQRSSESFVSSPRIVAAVAAARTSSSPSLTKPILSRGSSLGSRSSLAHSAKLGSPRGDLESESMASSVPRSEMVTRLTPILFAAVRHNKFDTVEKLISDLPQLVDIVDDSTIQQNTLLHVACCNGHARIARFLIKSGINVDATNSEGNTPLHFCYMYGRNQLVSILISHNANENARNRKDQIPAQLLNTQ